MYHSEPKVSEIYLSMVLVSAIVNVFTSLIVVVISIVKHFYVRIGIIDLVGIFVMGLLNIIYSCIRLYALRLHQRANELNQAVYYDTEESEPLELIQEMETAL